MPVAYELNLDLLRGACMYGTDDMAYASHAIVSYMHYSIFNSLCILSCAHYYYRFASIKGDPGPYRTASHHRTQRHSRVWYLAHRDIGKAGDKAAMGGKRAQVDQDRTLVLSVVCYTVTALYCIYDIASQRKYSEQWWYLIWPSEKSWKWLFTPPPTTLVNRTRTPWKKKNTKPQRKENKVE